MPSAETNISEQKKEIIKNLYDSGIPEDFIALQLDLEISLVIDILKELEAYEGEHRAG
jgi:hypothetical protein